MFEDSLTKLLQCDRLLNKKIGTLQGPSGRNQLRYLELITEYLRNLSETTTGFQIGKRYDATLNAITELWVTSSKNPSIFRDAKEFEPILMRIPKYRDHFIHSFNVFLMGYYLLNRMKEINKDLNFRSNDYNLTWMLASTFHDVGYAIEYMELWLNEIFRRFLGASPTFSFNIMEALPLIYVDFLHLISHWHTHSMLASPTSTGLQIEDWSFYDEVSSKLVEKHHGVLSGLMLAHLLAIREGFAAEGKWDFLYNHLPACHAICVHNLPSIPISFGLHPIAFTLTLCDELQDWGRPSAFDEHDVLYLNNVRITGTQTPKVELSIEVSKKRKKRVKEALSRLYTRGIIEVSIVNTKGERVLRIRD